jgi:hypothetical protein
MSPDHAREHDDEPLQNENHLLTEHILAASEASRPLPGHEVDETLGEHPQAMPGRVGPTD